MAIFKNITSTPVKLVDGDNYSTQINSITIDSIMISNNSSSECTVGVYLEDKDDVGTDYYLCKNLKIPGNVSLVLDEPFTYNVQGNDLKIETSSNPDLTVIVN